MKRIELGIETCGACTSSATCAEHASPTPAIPPWGAAICIKCQRILGNDPWTAPICASCFSQHTEPDSELGAATVAVLKAAGQAVITGFLFVPLLLRNYWRAARGRPSKP